MLSQPTSCSIAFPVDGQLLRLLPRASASLRNPDVQLPLLRSNEDGYYLEMRIAVDSQETSEVAITRRIPLEQLSDAEWQLLRMQYAELDLRACARQGRSKGLEAVVDRRLQRLLTTLLTFLNPRQVAIVLHLYRLAAQQDRGAIVSFRSNDLLQALGYKRTKAGGFAAKLRSQLHCDLVALHRTELLMTHSALSSSKTYTKESIRSGHSSGYSSGQGSAYSSEAKVVLKSILRIQDFEIKQVPRQFDLLKAADYTYELADAYTICLEFFEGPSRTGDYVLFAGDLDMTQKLGNAAQNDYKTKLLIYLASRLEWDVPEDGQYLTISKQYLFKNLDLLGTNTSRNNQLFWRTVEALKQADYLISAQELPGRRKVSIIQFQLNSEKLKRAG